MPQNAGLLSSALEGPEHILAMLRDYSGRRNYTMSARFHRDSYVPRLEAHRAVGCMAKVLAVRRVVGGDSERNHTAQEHRRQLPPAR